MAAPILGQVRDAVARSPLRASAVNRAGRRARSSPRVERLEAEEDARQLGAARADEPGEADDLAAPTVKETS